MTNLSVKLGYELTKFDFKQSRAVVQTIRDKISSFEMNDWIISIQSKGDTKYLLLGIRVRLLIIFLAFLVLFWTVFSSLLVLNNYFLKSSGQFVTYYNLNSNLVTLLGERDNLLEENQTLISQTQKALELVYQQEIELNRLKKEVAELDGPTGEDFQNNLRSSISDEIAEAIELPQNPGIVTTLSKVLSDITENQRRSQARITTLETELVNSQNQANAYNRRISNLLNELTVNITLATSGIEEVLTRVDVSPARIREELQVLNRNHNQLVIEDLELESLRGMLNSPVSGKANQLETALANLNILNIGYLSLPFGDPLKGNLRKTSGFGMRNHPITGKWTMHKGVDYGSRTGTPVYATGYGVVEFVGYKIGYGKTIIIKHISGLKTLYAHLSKINVNKGEFVTLEHKIGAVGSTGISTGPHLHYEITRNNKAINPEIFMKV